MHATISVRRLVKTATVRAPHATESSPKLRPIKGLMTAVPGPESRAAAALPRRGDFFSLKGLTKPHPFIIFLIRKSEVLRRSRAQTRTRPPARPLKPTLLSPRSTYRKPHLASHHPTGGSESKCAQEPVGHRPGTASAGFEALSGAFAPQSPVSCNALRAFVYRREAAHARAGSIWSVPDVSLRMSWNRETRSHSP